MIGPRTTGWIGADVGNSTVKLAQIERTSTGYRLAAAAIVPRGSCWGAGEDWDRDPGSSAAELGVARSLRAGFRGRRLAATLPMSICDAYALPQLEEQESASWADRVRALETVAQRSANHFQAAFWGAAAGEERATATQQAVAVPTCWADQLCEDVARVGWSCQVLDAMPFCLARAVCLHGPQQTAGPVAALDWGYRRATFCLVAGGQPVYVRRLKECGLERIVATLADHLQVDPHEAHRLLVDYGVTPKSNSAEQQEARVVAELVAEPLAHLEKEIRRTIAYLENQRRELKLQQMQLFGGGGAISGVAAHLAGRLSLDVACWQMDGPAISQTAAADAPSCLFGPAVALSALAWEKR